MADEPSHMLPDASGTPSRAADVVSRALRTRNDWRPLFIAAAVFVMLAAVWYLLKELAPLLRPLVLAGFLCYVILPIHIRLCQRVHPTVSVVILSASTLVLLFGLGAMIAGNLVSLNDDLPRLLGRMREMWSGARAVLEARLPRWLTETAGAGEATAEQTSAQIRGLVLGLVNGLAQWFGEFLLLSFYLVFLLAEARQLPRRVQSGFSPDRGAQILEICGSINRAMSSYLRVKVIASLCTAIPALVILRAFGVPFAVMWGVLVFLGNFIPYVGSIFAFVLPVVLAFLELEPVWKAVAVLALLLVNQFVNNNVIEPRLTARAVDLSPVVVLMSLSFWGLCWGVTGMFLAVPLTVMVKIVLGNIPITRPLARLMSQR